MKGWSEGQVIAWNGKFTSFSQLNKFHFSVKNICLFLTSELSNRSVDLGCASSLDSPVFRHLWRITKLASS